MIALALDVGIGESTRRRGRQSHVTKAVMRDPDLVVWFALTSSAMSRN